MSLRDAIGSAIRAIGQGLRGILTDEVEAVEAYGQLTQLRPTPELSDLTAQLLVSKYKFGLCPIGPERHEGLG